MSLRTHISDFVIKTFLSFFFPPTHHHQERHVGTMSLFFLLETQFSFFPLDFANILFIQYDRITRLVFFLGFIFIYLLVCITVFLYSSMHKEVTFQSNRSMTHPKREDWGTFCIIWGRV